VRHGAKGRAVSFLAEPGPTNRHYIRESLVVFPDKLLACFLTLTSGPFHPHILKMSESGTAMNLDQRSYVSLLTSYTSF